MRNLLIMMFFLVFVTGCGEGDKQTSKSAPAASKPAASTAKSSAGSSSKEITPGVSRMVDGILIVDHTRDEKEFELRHTIGGIKRMIKSYTEQGMDTNNLKAELADMKKKLKELISG